MASVTTPRIDKIIRLNNYDLLGTKCKQYQMYMCLDTLQLWYDESDSKRVLYGYTGVDTVNDLQNKLIPDLGTTYYCWESNSLWLWMNRWVCIYSDNKYPSAYRTDNDYIQSVYIDDENPTIVDNNGLLRDGSVVIRDANRIIKGRMYVSDTHDNLIFSSFLGAEWTAKNNEMYVDYSEKPSKDPSKYVTDTHKYRVWHSGNLKLEDFDMTGVNIINKIHEAQADGSLSDPLDLNVDRLDGLHATDLALKNHIHDSNDISDFAQASKVVVENALKDRLTNMIFKGAKITWVEASQKFMLSTDNFIVTLTGGVTGQATVTNNTNTTIAVTVDPDKHTHQDILDRIDAIGTGSSVDLTNYYKKKETEDLIDSYFTTTPTNGKALLVNSDGNLPRKCFNSK